MWNAELGRLRQRTECGFNAHRWGQNPVVAAKIEVDGVELYAEREGTYYDEVQK